MPEAERSTGEFWPFTVRYRGLSRQGPRIESGRSSLFYPPRDVPAGQVDLPSAGEVHDLIIPVVLGGVIASHLAVAEAEHIAHGVEGRVHNRVSGREEVGEQAAERGADVGVLGGPPHPPASRGALGALGNDRPPLAWGRPRAP